MHFSKELLSDLHQTLIFVHAVAFCSQLQSFKIFFTFCIFLRNYWLILIKLWFLFMLWHSAANCKVSKFSSLFAFFSGTTGLILINFDFCSCCGTLQPIVKFQNFLTFLHFSQELLVLILIKLWFLFMLWHSAANCKVSNFLQFLAFFSGTTGLILIKLWFLFMLCHSAANCKVSKFSSLFCIFLKNYWSSSNFDFCSCCGILQPLAKFHKFSHFLAFFSGTTGLILIKLWFLFMLWHSAANCKVSKFFSLFCIFLKNYWSSSNIDFCSCCGILQPVAKFHKFLSFWHFSQELLVWSWSNFDFCLCCGTLQPIVKFHKFSSLFGIFLRNFWSYLHQTLIFVHAVAFCSQL